MERWICGQGTLLLTGINNADDVNCLIWRLVLKKMTHEPSSICWVFQSHVDCMNALERFLPDLSTFKILNRIRILNDVSRIDEFLLQYMFSTDLEYLRMLVVFSLDTLNADNGLNPCTDKHYILCVINQFALRHHLKALVFSSSKIPSLSELRTADQGWITCSSNYFTFEDRLNPGVVEHWHVIGNFETIVQVSSIIE
ncbi:hypothetical protein GJ496_000633 [Pomphorhynchus laevis]|nr:hypothetical protein GJ496_000633 [Pomphorhynchus laevis]